MGTNYYLKKKNQGFFYIPKASLETALEKFLEQEARKGRKDVILNLNALVEKKKELHIGKSSCGWYFSLCIYPCFDIYSLEDWKQLFLSEDYFIENEYGKRIASEEIINIITKRKSPGWNGDSEEYEKKQMELYHSLSSQHPYHSYEDFLKENHAERGVNGLLRPLGTLLDLRKEKAFQNYLPILNPVMYEDTDFTYYLTQDWEGE